jgi:hypothetical protein
MCPRSRSTHGSGSSISARGSVFSCRVCGAIDHGRIKIESSTVASHVIVLPTRRIRSVTRLSGLVNQPGQPSHSRPLKSTVEIA